MNWDQIQGNWKEMTGKVKEKWGKLTENDLTVIAGKREQLSGILQQRYGYAKEQAEKELDEFMKTLKPRHCTGLCTSRPFPRESKIGRSASVRIYRALAPAGRIESVA